MKKVFCTLMIFSLLQSWLFGDPLEIGSPAPRIEATNDKGEKIDLGAALSSGTSLVFFYPKAMTPGCTKQVCSLRDAWDVLQERDVQIFGVSTDTAELQAEFRGKHTLPFTLIADTDGAVCTAFGKGRFSRQAYIFKDGVLVWRDLKAATSEQAGEVLAALDSLQK